MSVSKYCVIFSHLGTVWSNIQFCLKRQKHANIQKMRHMSFFCFFSGICMYIAVGSVERMVASLNGKFILQVMLHKSIMFILVQTAFGHILKMPGGAGSLHMQRPNRKKCHIDNICTTLHCYFECLNASDVHSFTKIFVVKYFILHSWYANGNLCSLI